MHTIFTKYLQQSSFLHRDQKMGRKDKHLVANISIGEEPEQIIHQRENMTSLPTFRKMSCLISNKIIAN